MFDFIRGRFSHQFNSFRQRWCQQRTLPLTDVLSAERVEKLLVEEGIEFRESLFTPLVTLWTFLGQVFHPDHSCREAVARLIAFLVGQGQRPYHSMQTVPLVPAPTARPASDCPKGC